MLVAIATDSVAYIEGRVSLKFQAWKNGCSAATDSPCYRAYAIDVANKSGYLEQSRQKRAICTGTDARCYSHGQRRLYRASPRQLKKFKHGRIAAGQPQLALAIVCMR